MDVAEGSADEPRIAHHDLSRIDLETIAARVSGIGFDTLELAAWPVETETTEADALLCLSDS